MYGLLSSDCSRFSTTKSSVRAQYKLLGAELQYDAIRERDPAEGDATRDEGAFGPTAAEQHATAVPAAAIDQQSHPVQQDADQYCRFDAGPKRSLCGPFSHPLNA